MNLKKYLLEGMSSTTNLLDDSQIMRMIIVAEADTVNFYEQMAANASSENTKKMLLDISKEEKVHMYEALMHLEMLDKETKDVKRQAQDETKELLRK